MVVAHLVPGPSLHCDCPAIELYAMTAKWYYHERLCIQFEAKLGTGLQHMSTGCNLQLSSYLCF